MEASTVPKDDTQDQSAPPAGTNGSGDAEQIDREEVIVDGSTGQLSMSVGGKRPTTSGLRLTGGKVDVEGQFDKGERIVLHVEAEVGEVAFVDSRDPKTGRIIGCERRHKARIVGVERQ